MPETTNDPGRASPRVAAADGVRGLLALVVLTFHFTWPFGVGWFALPANAAVCAFFVLSGYVLTRSWKGRFGVFLVRRFIRLWPLYALSLSVGYGFADVHPIFTQYFWYPILTQSSKPGLYTPIWSLHVEAWAMLFMPFIVWIAKGKIPRIVFGFLVFGVASIFYGKFTFGHFFLLGAVAARWSFQNRFLESAMPQWLGKISYSLYLTHLFVFETGQRVFGLLGLAASLPVAFPVAWIVWRFVEQPSIELSRAVSRRLQRAIDLAASAMSGLRPGVTGT